MQDFAFIDETLDRNLTHTYHLSIQASLNGFSFCILDPVTNKYIVLVHQNLDKLLPLEDNLLKVEKFIESNDILSNKKYKSIKLMWISEKNLLIPEQLFLKENLKLHFEFTHKLDDLDELHFNQLHYLNAYSVFVVPNLVANLFAKYFPEIKFYNQQQVLIDDILEKSIAEKPKIAVYVHPNFIDIAITSNHKLIFINSFKYKAEVDIAYFVLMLLDQFRLEGEHVELDLYGLIDKKSNSISHLQKYIKHFRFDHLPEDFTYSYTINKVPQHQFSNLFRLFLCE